MSLANSKIEILERAKQKKRKIKFIQRVCGSILSLFICGAFFYLLNIDFFRITTIKIQGETIENKEDLDAVIKDFLSGRYLLLVPKDSVFFFQEEFLITLLKNKFPRLSQVEISMPSFNTVLLQVSDKKARMLWCAVENSNSCYYLDGVGNLYSTAPNFSGNIFFKIYGQVPNSPIGQQVIDPLVLESIDGFLLKLPEILIGLETNNKKWEIDHVDDLSDGDFRIVVKNIKNGDIKWGILFNENNSSEDLLLKIKTASQMPVFRQELSNSSKVLEYIDLRFERKIFYRFKLSNSIKESTV